METLITAAPSYHRLRNATARLAVRRLTARTLRGPIGSCRAKRSLDLVLLVLTSPVWLPLLCLAALVVKLDSSGSVIYGHERIGFRGRRFTMWKFRTMVRNGDEVLALHLQARPEARQEWSLKQKLKHDPRITRAGFWLRRFSLDELPQVINVLTGDMSLVGPRPIYDDNEVRRWGTGFANYQSARPGLTGVWQVSGRNDTTYDQRIAMDTEYVRCWSLFRDLWIILCTFKAVLSGRGAY